MSVVYSLILTAAVLGAAVYAQRRIPFHTTSASHAWIARLILLIVGIAFGIAMVTAYSNAQGWLAVIAFLAGFGLVHVPAAAILFLKQQRARS
jgi:L-asparagine transporter-like permease